MKLKLAEGLSLPLDTVTEKLCWLGRTGSGKTYGAMKLAELMLEAGAQIGALDPVGVWRALRVPAVKGGPSFEVVMTDELRAKLEAEFPALAKRQQPCTCVSSCHGSQALGIGWICTAQRNSGLTYRLFGDASGRPAAIQCYICGRVSHNASDVAEKYCGGCHRFHEDAR